LKGQTHQLEDQTHQLEDQTHQAEVQKKDNLPNELKIKLENLSRRPKIEELKSIIYALCVWSPLTAQEIAELLKRKDKKHLVRQYLTPLVKDGLLKYVYPERGNSPNQAYAAV
jgi:ATP-dependent DNA helicase RecG